MFIVPFANGLTFGRKPWAVWLWLGVAVTTLLSACEMPPKEPPQPLPEAPQEQQQPCPSLSAPELGKSALISFGRGEHEAARRYVECALEINPDSYRARMIFDQMDRDPVESLGTRYYWYTIQEGETVSMLAERFLGSSDKFIILARYNDILVPDAVSYGRRLKIPGTQSSPPPAEPPKRPPPASATALLEESRGARAERDLEKAHELLSRAVTIDASSEEAKAELGEVETALIDKYSTEAYEAEVRGEKDEAIRLWEKTLEIRPQYIEAQVNLRRLTEARND